MLARKHQRHASRGVAVALALVALLSATPAAAHTFGLSQLELHVADHHVDLRLTTDLEHLDLAAALDANRDDRVDATELDRGHDAVADYLIRRLTLSTDDQPCPGQLTALVHDAARTAAVVEARYTCPTPLGPLDIDSRLFSEQPGQHRLMVVIAEDGRRLRSALDRDTPTLHYEATAPDTAEPVAQTDERLVEDSAGAVVWQYLTLGIEHILIGLDHVLFLLALLLTARRLRTVIVLVSTFTVAHSITLASAALDLVTLPAALVEPLIAASIIVVAALNLRPPPLSPVGDIPPCLGGRLGGCRPDATLPQKGGGAERSEAEGAPGGDIPPCLGGRLDRSVPQKGGGGREAVGGGVFAFGLMHGFGFAGVLGELGLPSGQATPALLGFNLGVELGQLAIVAVTWPLLRLTMRWQHYRRVVQVASALIALAGIVWLVERLAGL